MASKDLEYSTWFIQITFIYCLKVPVTSVFLVVTSSQETFCQKQRSRIRINQTLNKYHYMSVWKVELFCSVPVREFWNIEMNSKTLSMIHSPRMWWVANYTQHSKWILHLRTKAAERSTWNSLLHYYIRSFLQSWKKCTILYTCKTYTDISTIWPRMGIWSVVMPFLLG